jgi:hypothetical protein
MKFLIRMAIDVTTNTPTPASWDEEVEAESKRAAARKFRKERGFQATEQLVITEVIPSRPTWGIGWQRGSGAEG